MSNLILLWMGIVSLGSLLTISFYRRQQYFDLKKQLKNPNHKPDILVNVMFTVLSLASTVIILMVINGAIYDNRILDAERNNDGTYNVRYLLNNVYFESDSITIEDFVRYNNITADALIEWCDENN